MKSIDLGDGPDARRRARQRERLLDEAKQPSRLWLELTAGALAAVAGSALVFMLLSGRAQSQGLHVVDNAGTLTFSEHSEVRPSAGSRVHVAHTAPHEAVIVLDSGELFASITSGLKNVWRFKVGPHEVIVRGTKLSVSWDPETEKLGVGVTEGKVEVHLSDGSIRFVLAGETLAFPEPQAQIEIPEPAPAAPLVTPKPKSAGPAPVSVVVKPLRSLVPEWKKQAEAGHYAKAVTLVEEQGLAAAAQDASVDDLLLLADAARLAHKVELGREVLKRLGTPEAHFRLGRLEFDARRFVEAAGWFDAYVNEAPKGPFIEEAMGRRVDAWDRGAKGSQQADRAAGAYLSAFPHGAYAPLANRIQGE